MNAQYLIHASDLGKRCKQAAMRQDWEEKERLFAEHSQRKQTLSYSDAQRYEQAFGRSYLSTKE
jgi:hypothetical protein